MANQPHQFKHRDIVRAFRAASAAGVSNPSVQVQCPNGTVITIDSKPDETLSIGKVAKPSVRSAEAGRLPKRGKPK